MRYLNRDTGEEMSEEEAQKGFEYWIDDVNDWVRINSLVYRPSFILKGLKHAYFVEFNEWMKINDIVKLEPLP